MRRKLSLAATALVIALLAMACTPEDRHTFEQINAFRAANGVAPVEWEAVAHEKALAWSQHMATQGRLSHSRLSDGITPGWTALAENVAMNPTLDGAIRALELSPTHRANLLDRRFTHAATGVVKVNGMWWVTQIFIRR